MIIRVPNTLVPKEARVISANFRKAAKEVRTQAAQLKNISNNLNTTWQGNSKNRFMSEINPELNNLLDYARYLEKCARTIEQMKVTTWETKHVED